MDQPRTYTTSRIASAVGIHPNTVRLYERIGFITAPERLANGYRVFTDLHLLQVRLVRAALNVELVQNGLRREVLAIVETMASQRYDEAISLARQRIDHLRRERRAAEDALRHVRDLLTRSDGSARAERLMLTRKEAADQLDTTIDALRNWEMNGLLQVKRKQNGYRVYSAPTSTAWPSSARCVPRTIRWPPSCGCSTRLTAMRPPTSDTCWTIPIPTMTSCRYAIVC